jgi:hypothetical protein
MTFYMLTSDVSCTLSTEVRYVLGIPVAGALSVSEKCELFFVYDIIVLLHKLCRLGPVSRQILIKVRGSCCWLRGVLSWLVAFGCLVVAASAPSSLPRVAAVWLC